MAITRITTTLLANRSLRDINAQLSRISTLQEQLATGLRVNRPSDDPIDARRAINVRVLLAKNEQFQSNIDDVTPQIDETATTLLTVNDVLQRALELTVQVELVRALVGAAPAAVAELSDRAHECSGLLRLPPDNARE